MKLHLRALQYGNLAACGVAVALMSGVLLVWISARSDVVDDVHAVIAVFAIALQVSIMSTGLASPVDELSRSAPRHTDPTTGGLYAFALALGCIALASIQWSLGDEAFLVVRGYLGIGGAALIAAVVLGPGVAWCVPVLMAVAPIILGHLGAHVGPLDWSVRPVQDASSWGISLSLAAAGAAILTLRGLKPLDFIELS